MEQQKLLEKYLQDTLTETERQKFDTFLKNDPDFKEEVAFQMDVKRAVTASEDDDFRALLSDFESEARREDQTTTSVGPKNGTFPTKWLVAASIALIAGLAYFFSVNQSTNPQNLYTQNFKPYRNVTYPITRGAEATDTKTLAFSAYAKGDYQEAVPLFTELYASEKKSYYLFYKANALIQMNRAGEAVSLLQEHSKSDDSLADRSYWYLAMAYLQMDNIENAKTALKEVVDKNAYKAKDAKRLLDEL